MHEFPCNCGNVILVDPPSENAGYLVWDCDVDLSIESRRMEINAFLAAVASGERDSWIHEFYGSPAIASRLAHKTDTDVIEDILSKHDQHTRICYRCPRCRRIYMELTPGTYRFLAFAVDR